MSAVVELVKKTCLAAAKGALPDAEVVAPLPVWDSKGTSMGVQIKAPRLMGPQRCEVIGSFVLTAADLRSAASIHAKAAIAVMAMAQDVQVQIRPVKQSKVA